VVVAGVLDDEPVLVASLQNLQTEKIMVTHRCTTNAAIATKPTLAAFVGQFCFPD